MLLAIDGTLVCKCISTYAIEGMTTNECARTIASCLAQHPKAMEVKVSLAKRNAVIQMRQDIPTDELQVLLPSDRKYQIIQADAPVMPLEDMVYTEKE